MSSVRLEKVEKIFGTTRVIKGIDLEVRSGEFMVFVGPSGCGKSTLLRIIAGLEQINGGEIYFDEEKVSRLSPSNRRIAMVFQSYALYPHMKVYDNMAFGMKLAKSSPEKVRERVMQAAEMLQLTPLLDRLPRQLSGGQRQRVAIGRAIVRDPRVFLFDEPLSNLDAALRVATRIEIASLHRSMEGTTMVYVTHDQIEAMTMADRITVLREGEMEQVGTPDELYSSPKTVFVAGFIGSPKMNLLSGDHGKSLDAATVGIRPEHLDLVPELPADKLGWKGKIIHIENIGADCFSFVDIGGDEPLVFRQPGTAKGAIGDELAVVPSNNELIHRFDAEGKALS